MAVNSDDSHTMRAAFGKLLSFLSITDRDKFDRLSGGRSTGGSRVLVPALESDSVHDISMLVRQAGGDAMVAVVGPMESRDGKHGFTIRSARMTTEETDADSGHDVPVGRTCTLGDLFRVLLPGSSITLRLADGEELWFEDGGEADVSDGDSLLPA